MLVVTGRSRLALYLARIPAGLAIIVPLVAIGFTIVCTVCVFAAPTTLSSRCERARRPVERRPPATGRPTMPTRSSATSASEIRPIHPGSSTLNAVDKHRPLRQRSRGPRRSVPSKSPRGPPAKPRPTQAQIRAVAALVARMNYADYSRQFLYPSTSLMIKSGLWLELEAVIGFVVGLGLGSLIGQRTVAVVLMIVLEVVLTPILSRARIPHSVEPPACRGRPGHRPPRARVASPSSAAAAGGQAAGAGTPGCSRSRPPWPYA